MQLARTRTQAPLVRLHAREARWGTQLTAAWCAPRSFGAEPPGNAHTMEMETKMGRACERRESSTSSSPAPAEIVAAWAQAAERQLLEAREQLKAARRRVVQLEDVVTSWAGFAATLSPSSDHAETAAR